MTPAWRVAAALALACGLDWGRWVAGRDGWCGRRTCPPDLDGQCRCASPPVPDPSDAAAYLADCARRGVEPGPLPSLEYRPGAGLWWAVECSPHDASIVVHVGYDYPTLWTLWGPGASTQGDHANLQACFRRAHHQVVDRRAHHQVVECTLRLVTAAAAALEHDHG